MSVLPHIETSQLICTANQLTGFYMRATLVLNGLGNKSLYGRPLTEKYETSINIVNASCSSSIELIYIFSSPSNQCIAWNSNFFLCMVAPRVFYLFLFFLVDSN